MKVHHLDDMTRGWFVGDFEPTLYRTDAVEVAVKHYVDKFVRFGPAPDDGAVGFLDGMAPSPKATADGDGSLLDHSVVMLGSGLGNPDVHDHLNLPIVVAGGAGNLKGGRHIKYAQPTALANVHLTMLNLAGVNIETFGDSDGRVAELLEPASL